MCAGPEEAIDQIIKADRPGIVALDMSLAWNKKNQPVVGSIHNAFIDMKLEAQARQFFERNWKWIEERGAGRGVLGIVLFNFVLRLEDEERWRPHRHAMWCELPQNEQEERLYESFRLKFDGVTPNRKETIESERAAAEDQLL